MISITDIEKIYLILHIVLFELRKLSMLLYYFSPLPHVLHLPPDCGRRRRGISLGRQLLQLIHQRILLLLLNGLNQGRRTAVIGGICTSSKI